MMGVGAKRALGLYRSCAPRQLRAGLRGKRLRLSDDERRRLAVKAVRSKYSCGFPMLET